MISFTLLRPSRYDPLGFIPSFLSEKDPTSAKAQLDQNYISGWNEFRGFNLNLKTMELKYPGDPPMLPLAKAVLHNKEEIYVYPHAWVLILNIETKEYEISRMD
jgi:hypothetical protein